MSLASDLLKQVERLARIDKKKPKQANLRRAVSSAYYSLFHLLLDEGSRQLVSNVDLRHLVRRGYYHGDMKAAAKSFSGGTLPTHVKRAFAGPLPQEVRSIAKAFVDLQQARHEADYDLLKSFSRPEALGFVSLAKSAFADWKKTKGDPEAKTVIELFLSSLLLWERWKK